MKFLLAVLAIHLIGELISNKRKNNRVDERKDSNRDVRHPAEYELR